MKHTHINRILTISLLLFVASLAQAKDTLTIASWNIRVFSNNSRDASELTKIASIIKKYDIVAIQEVKDAAVLNRLKKKCPGYDYIASKRVGTRTHKEIYAFFYKKSLIDPLGKPAILADPQNLFIREPFIGTFKAGNFDFTLCTIHLLYGKNQAERRKELILMDEVLAIAQKANGREDDLILLGDFNFGPDDHGWQVGKLGYINLINAKTTVGSRSPYDNIWINKKYTREYAGKNGMFKFDTVMFKGDLKTARREVSDHRPVYAEFYTDKEDDDINEYGDLTTAAIVVAGVSAVQPSKSTKYENTSSSKGNYIASVNSEVFHKIGFERFRTG